MTTSIAPVRSFDAVTYTPVTQAPAEVVKRDGRRAPWDPDHITRAIALAFHASRTNDAVNPHADDAAARYGLGSITSATMVEAAAANYRQFDGIWFNDIVLTGSNGQTASVLFRLPRMRSRRSASRPSAP